MEILLSRGVDVRDKFGHAIPPKGQKELALLAILALSPDKRRRRAWLQDMLWGDSTAELGALSLRRALANIRVAFGTSRAALCADKNAVWLDQTVTIKTVSASQDISLLDDLVIKEQTFCDWRRDLAPRAKSQENLPAPLSHSVAPPRISIRLISIHEIANQNRIEQQIRDFLSERFINFGPIEIEQLDQHETPNTAAPLPDVIVEIESHAHSADCVVMVRIYTGEGRFFLWSKRLTVPMDRPLAAASDALWSFANAIVDATLEKCRVKLRSSNYFLLQHATALLFTGQQRDSSAAEQILLTLLDDPETRSLAQSWRAFQRLTDMLEHGGSPDTLGAEAMDLCREAYFGGKSNSQVCALMASVETKLYKDPERGLATAQAALNISDTNPYALSAAAHAHTLLGQPDMSHQLSKRTMIAGTGMHNDFCWNMQFALASLSVENYANAYQHALQSHFKLGSYRPALRYLILLASLSDDPAVTARVPEFERKLAQLEPTYTRKRMADPNYPIHTFKSLGLWSEVKLPS